MTIVSLRKFTIVLKFTQSHYGDLISKWNSLLHYIFDVLGKLGVRYEPFVQCVGVYVSSRKKKSEMFMPLKNRTTPFIFGEAEKYNSSKSGMDYIFAEVSGTFLRR